MPKHPANGALRRLLDEPVAVAVADEDHAFQCLRCQARMSLMREDDVAVSLALGGHFEFKPLCPLHVSDSPTLVLKAGLHACVSS